MKSKRRILSFILTLSILVSAIAGLTISASATAYSFSSEKAGQILDQIATEYSSSLRDAISDLFYDSDYSDFLNYTSTLRSYETLGNVKAWPITNADSYGSSVMDRGEKVNWGWNCKGCMSYAVFFSYSVYGTFGTKSAEKVTLNPDDTTALKDYLAANVQPGEHFRYERYNSDGVCISAHSVIYLADGVENNKEGFYIAEYWGGGKYDDAQKKWAYSTSSDQFYIRFYSYSEFAKKYNGDTWFVYNAYESSDYANEAPETTLPDTKLSRDIVLVLDVSGSMSGDKITYTKTAAKRFVEQILDVSEDTRIALVTYGSYANTVVDLTDDKDTLMTSIDSLRVTGNTNMYGGLELAGTILGASTSDKKAIVIMTDGEANTGTYGTARTVVTEEGDSVWLTGYGDAIYGLAQSYIKDEGYTIYSLGFGLTENSNAYNLIKYISSFNSSNERNFWSVTADNIDDIIFTYEDIASSISTKKKIVIAIDCPVEVTVSLEGETLSKDNLSTDFGKLVVTPVDDGYQYLFTLEDSRDYNVQIQGTGDGSMNFKITYTEGDAVQYREFLNVPVTENTTITTSATDRRADFALYVDDDGDGVVDSGWVSTVDETVDVPSGSILAELYPTFEADTEDVEDSSEPEDKNEPVIVDTPSGSSSTEPEKQEPASNNPFVDVPDTAYYYDAVKWAVEEGVTTGTSSRTFSPNATCTRGQAVTFLWRAAGSPSPVSNSNPFADVKSSDYYYDAVLWAVEQGITVGTSASTFSPDQTVTRAHVVTFLWRAEGSPAADGSNPFVDVSEDAYYVEAVLWAVENGITAGTSANTFSPDDGCTRAQIVTFLCRGFNK